MARDRHESAGQSPDDISFEAIFGSAEEEPSDETIICATDETIALLNGVFAPGQSGLDTQALWSLISFG